MIRRQPPAYSPLTAEALLGGALAGGSTSGHLVETLRERYRNRQVLLVDSGTSALTLALAAAIAGRPAPLIALPAYGCYDLATAALGVGADVILYDVDPDTLSPDLASLDRALEARPAAVVAAYWYGVPFDVRALSRRVAEAGAVLVEDAAQAFGASLEDLPCGAIAPMGILSFGRGKGVTGGGGGALLLDHEASAAPDPRPSGGGWPGWGKAWAQWALARPGWYWLPSALPFLRLGDTVYHSPRPVEAMPRLHQEVLRRLLPSADQEARTRQAHGQQFAELVAASTTLRPVRVSAGRPGFLRYPVLSPDAKFRSPEARRLGVMPGYPMTLADLGPLRSVIRNRDERLPGARALVAELVTLPTHSLLREQDLTRLAELIA